MEPSKRRLLSGIAALTAGAALIPVTQAQSVPVPRNGRAAISRGDGRKRYGMLIDLRLSDGTGFELIAHLKALRPFAEAIALSGQEDETHAMQAFRVGATGFLAKNSWFRNFPLAVLAVVNGVM